MSDTKPSTVPLRPDLSRRLPDPPAAANQLRRPTTPTMPTPKPEPSEGKRLIVGRDISLTGEITACDVLVVEGRVEASLGDSRMIEIAESGVFKGKAEIDNAEIAGRYEGELTVRDRLYVRATGKVVGSVRYGRLEIECGGEIVGDVQVLSRAQPAPVVDSSPTTPEPSLMARGIAD
ncbi:MAG: polymer-forming cytoskeletal protein [Proteobacteria bacterium]|nr:polymer-forming cytoskeletal protein [Pseudomonadota bacterium]